MNEEDKNILIDIPMPIITPRLMLRNVLPGDGAEVFRAKQETWDKIHKWMPWAVDIETPESDEINVCKSHADFILRKDIRIHGFERKTGKMVVFTGLHRFDWQTKRFEIGYWVRESTQGKGYATEAANALTRYAFEALGAKTLAITHAEGNEPSKRIIEKLGFKKEGVLLNSQCLPDERMVNLHSYARIDTKGLPDLQVSWGKEPDKKEKI